MNLLCSVVDTIIKELDCSDAWYFVAHYCSKIQDVEYDKSYSSVSHADSFRINIDLTDMNRITDRIMDISNGLHNINVPIH